MVFSSSIFLFGFLPLLLGLYFLFDSKLRNYILLLFSLIFYGFGGPKLLIMMIAVVIMDYIAAIVIDKNKNGASKHHFYFIQPIPSYLRGKTLSLSLP